MTFQIYVFPGLMSQNFFLSKLKMPVFVTDKRFQPNLMFVNIPDCPTPTNVRLGWFDKRSRLLLKS